MATLQSPPRTTVLTDPNRYVSPQWYGWFLELFNFVTALDSRVPAGITAVIVTAKLTGGGANGSMTFTNGILTAQTPAT